MRILKIEFSKRVAAGTLILLTAFTLSFSNKNKTGFASKPIYHDPRPQLIGNRFFTFNTVVRVRQIEVSRDVAYGPDESSIHTPKEARAFREAVEEGWPGARITWAFSWLALKDQRADY